jgi:putative membrane protein
MSVDGEGTDPSSRARDHMANERTYLAWLRTAVNVMIVGLAVARFGSGGRPGALALSAGALLVATGAAGLGYGTLRYRAVNRELESRSLRHRQSQRGAPAAAVVLLMALVVATVLLVVEGMR